MNALIMGVGYASVAVIAVATVLRCWIIVWWTLRLVGRHLGIGRA